MHRLSLLFLFFCSTAYSIDRRCLLRKDTISWANGQLAATRAVNKTNCDFGDHTFVVNRPLNSSKFIRARIVSIEEDTATPISAFEIKVEEIGVAEDGTEITLRRKNLDGVDDSVVSSPYTSLIVTFSKHDPRNKRAEAIVQFTLEDEGCPYPFLESRIGSPLIIASDVIAYECDFSVTSVDKGALLELTSINESIPHQRHSVAVVVYDGYTHTRLQRVQQEEFDTDLKEHLGTNKATIHVTNPAGGGTEHTSFITINSFPDDCKCPEEKVILNDTSTSYTFKMEKSYCFHLNCSVLVQIAEPLRHDYRLKIEPSDHDETSRTFSIRDGGVTDEFLLVYLPFPRVYISVHPSIVLNYNKRITPTTDFVEVHLEPTSEKEQALCNCPPFQPDLTLTLPIDPSCPAMDCLWTLPKISDALIPMVTVESNSSREYETFYLTTTNNDRDHAALLINGFNQVLYFPGDRRMQQTHVNLHYHRKWRNYPVHGKGQSTPTFYKIALSSYYNLTEYEHACGCFNRTIKIDPSSELNFSSPQYPLHYCNDLNCRTVFEAPEGYAVVFQPRVLSLQKEADYLNVYDIIDGKEVIRERYTGTYLDGFTTESRTNVLLAVFTSDGAINYDGFNATVYAKKLEEFEDYYDDAQNSSGWLWKIVLSVLVVGAVVGAVVHRRRRRTDGISLSFAPVSFMNNGGEFDDGSVSFSYSR